MPIKLEFYSLEERKPKHYEEIVFLKRSYGFFEEFRPIQSSVEYCWFELGEGDKPNWIGQCGYDQETEFDNNLGDIVTSDLDGSKWILYAMVDGYLMNEDYFWAPAEDFHNSLPYKD